MVGAKFSTRGGTGPPNPSVELPLFTGVQLRTPIQIFCFKTWLKLVQDKWLGGRIGCCWLHDRKKHILAPFGRTTGYWDF